MILPTHLSVAVLASFVLGQLVAGQTHGEGEEGSSMGPVAFMWPADRHWEASQDNIGPCGSAAAIANRTIFPLSELHYTLRTAPLKPNAAARQMH